MNITELELALRQAQAEPMAPSLASNELTRRSDRLLERRRLQEADFRDSNRTLDNSDFEDESQHGVRSGDLPVR